MEQQPATGQPQADDNNYRRWQAAGKDAKVQYQATRSRSIRE